MIRNKEIGNLRPVPGIMPVKISEKWLVQMKFCQIEPYQRSHVMPVVQA